MRSRAETRIVEPLDFEEAVSWSGTLSDSEANDSDESDDLDWCLDDPVGMTQSLKAIKSGRGRPIALLLAAAAALVTALLVLG